MRPGVVFPHAEIGNDPDTIRAFARTAEQVGFDHVLAYDHVLGAERSDRSRALTGGSYDETSPFHEVFVLFGFLAAVTTSLRFVTGVLVLPQRQTALVAKQAAEIDLLSGGRLDLGVGVGWNYVEYDALGQDFSTRGARQEEQVDVLRRLWKEPVGARRMARGRDPRSGRGCHIDHGGQHGPRSRGASPRRGARRSLRGNGAMPVLRASARLTSLAVSELRCDPRRDPDWPQADASTARGSHRFRVTRDARADRLRMSLTCVHLASGVESLPPSRNGLIHRSEESA